jgi:hypothetical protein
MGVSGGVWECGKPERFSIISMPQSEGEKGEVTFSLRPTSGRPLFGSPFSPCGFAECTKRGVRNGGSASSPGTAPGTLQGKE